MRSLFFCLILLGTYFPDCIAQNSDWKKELGFSESDKLLILHGDDLGVTHSVNKASIKGFEEGLMNSSSIMVPCPWFEEIKAYFLDHPEFDYGLHLTLTAEWKYLKWSGLADFANTKNLYDGDGYLHASVPPIVTNASVEEVEIEVRAQIEKALNSGLNPSHLDSHMGTLFSKEEFAALLIQLGDEYKIPVFLPQQVLDVFPNLKERITENTIITNKVYMNGNLLEKDKVFEYYDQCIRDLQPGLNEMILHLGLDNEELAATCVDHPEFGSAWRQHDLEYVISPHLRSILEESNVKLVTWRQIQEVIFQDK